VIAKAKDTEVKLRQAADAARKTAAKAASYTAFLMLIGAFIAAVAATIAGHRRDASLALRAALRIWPNRFADSVFLQC